MVTFRPARTWAGTCGVVVYPEPPTTVVYAEDRRNGGEK